jgi:hypothetical protein
MPTVNRGRAVSFLLRGPGALESRLARAAVLVLAVTGGGFLVWTAVIHLKLWATGYRDISVIGPLFLVQGIACIAAGVAAAALRRLVLLAAGAALAAATAAGLLLSVNVGLFGFTENLAVPYATLSLAVEFTAAFVLLAGAALLALAAPAGAPAGAASRGKPVPRSPAARSTGPGPSRRTRFPVRRGQ